MHKRCLYLTFKYKPENSVLQRSYCNFYSKISLQYKNVKKVRISYHNRINVNKSFLCLCRYWATLRLYSGINNTWNVAVKSLYIWKHIEVMNQHTKPAEYLSKKGKAEETIIILTWDILPVTGILILSIFWGILQAASVLKLNLNIWYISALWLCIVFIEFHELLSFFSRKPISAGVCCFLIDAIFPYHHH